MRWPKLVRDKAAAVPPEVPLARGERVLATAVAKGGATVVVTTRRLVATEGDLVDGRPWHLVDAGRWDPDEGLLRVTWVDARPGDTWVLDSPGGVPDALHERVQASVVLVEQVKLDRSRRARVVLRRDLATGRFLAQTIVGRGCDPDDPELLAATKEVAANLAEQVGHEPGP